MGTLTMGKPMEMPMNAAVRLAAKVLGDGYTLRALHEYTDTHGNVLYWKIRAKHSDGRKWIRPMTLHDGYYQLGEPAWGVGKKPLYLLAALQTRTDEIVFVVEGESCVDALQLHGVLATTSGGADSTDTTDWYPLANRRVVIWPDNDGAGYHYGNAVARVLLELDCKIAIVHTAALSLPIKGDVVDWLAANPQTTQAELLALPTCNFSEAELSTAQNSPLRAHVELLSASSITPEPIRWLWKDWLAKGKLHILAGAPGTGKTTISMAMAATITNGSRWPDGTRCASGHVLIWSGEDDPKDTLVPRLIAHGANLDHVHFVSCTVNGNERTAFDPSSDVSLLLECAARIGNVALLIVDPIVSAVAVDSHKNGEVRRALQPLVELAEKLGCAVVGISHFSKGTAGRDPTERVTGSIAFAALARIVMATAKRDLDDQQAQILVRTKSNIGPDGGGLHYTFEQVEIQQGVFASRVRWGDAIEGNARELLTPPETRHTELSATDEAIEFLRDLLTQGSVPAIVAQQHADELGISKKALRTARERLGIKPRKSEFNGGWCWALPSIPQPQQTKMPNKTEGAHSAQEGIFETAGHLRNEVNPNLTPPDTNEHGIFKGVIP